MSANVASDYRQRLIGVALMLRTAEMLQLVEQGWTTEELCKRYGITAARVNQLVGPSADVRSGRARARLLYQAQQYAQAQIKLQDPVCQHVTQLLREEGAPMLASTMLPILERNGYKCGKGALVLLCTRLYQSGKFTHYTGGWWFRSEPLPKDKGSGASVVEEVKV